MQKNDIVAAPGASASTSAECNNGSSDLHSRWFSLLSGSLFSTASLTSWSPCWARRCVALPTRRRVAPGLTTEATCGRGLRVVAASGPSSSRRASRARRRAAPLEALQAEARRDATDPGADNLEQGRGFLDSRRWRLERMCLPRFAAVEAPAGTASSPSAGAGAPLPSRHPCGRRRTAARRRQEDDNGRRLLNYLAPSMP
jgi:hypothetical protein